MCIIVWCSKSFRGISANVTVGTVSQYYQDGKIDGLIREILLGMLAPMQVPVERSFQSPVKNRSPHRNTDFGNIRFIASVAVLVTGSSLSDSPADLAAYILEKLSI